MSKLQGVQKKQSPKFQGKIQKQNWVQQECFYIILKLYDSAF